MQVDILSRHLLATQGSMSDVESQDIYI